MIKSDIIFVTTPEISGKKIKNVLGIVRGSAVRARWFGADIIAAIRNLFGGEIKEYSELLDQSRRQAVERMLADARKKGANAIVNMRFMTSQIGQNAAEILAYGTGVVV